MVLFYIYFFDILFPCSEGVLIQIIWGGFTVLRSPYNQIAFGAACYVHLSLNLVPVCMFFVDVGLIGRRVFIYNIRLVIY
jgi:hypothetical protein